MAVTPISTFDPSLAGTVLTQTTPSGTGLANGVSFTNDGQTCLLAIFGGTGTTVPTLDATGSLGNVALTDPTETAIANDSVPVLIGPFDRAAFGSTMTVGFSVATGLKVSAIRMPRQ